MDDNTPCPVCRSSRLRRVLSRSAVPVHQNALMPTAQAARSVTRGDLNLVCCEDCGFVFNRSFDLAKLAYGAGYDNVQTHSAVFRDYVDALAERLLNDAGVRNCRVVEIGCGDAYFLRKLVDAPGAGNSGIGFDPSFSGPEPGADDRLRIERRYFDQDCADTGADVVVSRHVIEHVPDPVAMLKAVRVALQRSPQARVYFETPCVEWILRDTVIWDFFYEHCSYFSAQSLSAAFQQAGFQVERVDHQFGSQYLWLEARVCEGPVSVALQAGTLPDMASAFRVNAQEMLTSLRARFMDLGQRESLAIWGAGAKGATLANLLDGDGRLFDCVIDINPNKQGCFVAGSGHPIVSLAEARARGVSKAVLMNPNYGEEAQRMIDESGAHLQLLEAI